MPPDKSNLPPGREAGSPGRPPGDTWRASDVRGLPGLKKKPSTSELLDWLKLLVAEDIPLDALQSQDDKVAIPPLHGALLKNEQDVSLFEKLVFMQQRNR